MEGPQFHIFREAATLKRILRGRGDVTAVGDEGGFARNLKSNEEACELIVKAIISAGYKPGKDIAIALDPAASSFFEDGAYNLSKSRQGKKTSAEMTALYQSWIDKYPIVSIEDGLAENDWDGFREHTVALGSRIQIVGDDIYVTNTRFIARGIAEKSSNAALIKLNQIGTVTETIEAIQLCRKAGWGFVISHRSGETEDTFTADFAVAMRRLQCLNRSTLNCDIKAWPSVRHPRREYAQIKYGLALRNRPGIRITYCAVGPSARGGIGAGLSHSAKNHR